MSIDISPRTQPPELPPDLSADDLVGLYRVMLLSRRIDDKEIQLKRQNKIFFQINGVGHEAILAAAAKVMKPGHDWFFTYYRDRALCLGLGVRPLDMFLQAVGAAMDPQSGGRQMPSHWSAPDLHIVSSSSPVGTQFLHAVGCAEGAYRAARIPGLEEKIRFEDDEVVLVTTGDGTTSEGEFWESLNTACNLRLPVLYLVEDNGYAISVPVEVNTAGGSISRLVRGFPHLYVEEVDGCDPVDSYAVFKRALRHCRERKGPALVHAHVIRPYSHSLSDDESSYRTAAERQTETERDPVPRFARFLVEEGILNESEIESLQQKVDAQVQMAVDEALQAPQPAGETLFHHVYSMDVDPTSEAFSSEPSPAAEDKPGTMVDLLNACLRDEMECDPRIVAFGQDVADASREGALEEVKGKGGVFKVTWGLQRKFGGTRVFNSPLAEANIVGRAIGMALRGLRPVAEIQFFDYIWPAYQQIHNELATMRWRSNGRWECPLVIRVAVGGYLRGGGPYHSQSGATLFTHVPGLRVVMPSNAEDANGLLRTAIRCDDPVLFLEHKHLYRQTYNKGVYPGPDYTIPFGRAAQRRAGGDVTIVTYGALVQRSLVAAKEVAKEGIEADVLDLRSLSPYDWQAIAASVQKTNRAVVVYEDNVSWGYGAEIAARIANELFAWLDAPVARVAATDTFVAYAPQLEEAILPQAGDIVEAIHRSVEY